MLNNPMSIKEEKKGGISPFLFLFLPVGVMLGLILVFFLFPSIVSGMAISLLGNTPKAFWFLSRATAISSYFVLWISMMLGLAMTTQLSSKGTNRAAIYEMHKFTSILGLVLAGLHALLLLGDQYLQFGLANILIPFSTTFYRPFWVGLGQVAFYVWLTLITSFYVRRQLSRTGWRWIHYASFATFLLALCHGITSGTDAGQISLQGFYWVSGGLFIFLTIFRILNSFLKTESTNLLSKIN
jgi:predicted ferric reductase